jgi:hypothetical protein
MASNPSQSVFHRLRQSNQTGLQPTGTMQVSYPPARRHRMGSDLSSFAHPDDVQWRDASPVSKKHAFETKDYRDTKRRPPALAPQSDLFKRSNPEDREDKRRSSPKTYDSRSFLGVEKPDDRHNSRGPRVLDERLRVKKDDSSTRVALPHSRPLTETLMVLLHDQFLGMSLAVILPR